MFSVSVDVFSCQALRNVQELEPSDLERKAVLLCASYLRVVLELLSALVVVLNPLDEFAVITRQRKQEFTLYIRKCSKSEHADDRHCSLHVFFLLSEVLQLQLQHLDVDQDLKSASLFSSER